MAENSNIEWTDNTWNVARGCTKVDGDCKFCYMYRDSFDGKRYNPRQIIKTKTVFDFPLKCKDKKSKVWSGRPLIFTSSLTDFFHESCDEFRPQAWDIIRQCPHLIFQILTKRPERIMQCVPSDWGDGWDNVWLGTSVGSDKGKQRIDDLLNCKSKTFFASIEPYWDEIFDFNNYLYTRYAMGGARNMYKQLNWVIVGGESGNDSGQYRYRPCKIEWIERIVSECISANVPVFVKQLGTQLAKDLKLTDRHGRHINEFPINLRVRQFPKLIL